MVLDHIPVDGIFGSRMVFFPNFRIFDKFLLFLPPNFSASLKVPVLLETTQRTKVTSTKHGNETKSNENRNVSRRTLFRNMNKLIEKTHTHTLTNAYGTVT